MGLEFRVWGYRVLGFWGLWGLGFRGLEEFFDLTAIAMLAWHAFEQGVLFGCFLGWAVGVWICLQGLGPGWAMGFWSCYCYAASSTDGDNITTNHNQSRTAVTMFMALLPIMHAVRWVRITQQPSAQFLLSPSSGKCDSDLRTLEDHLRPCWARRRGMKYDLGIRV